MALSSLPLSYCANVHPGETFAEARAGLERHTSEVRRRLGRPMAAGIWMTRSAVAEAIASPTLAKDLARWLGDAGLVCYTMNAFPFGNFHARRVKENVYLPDWTSPDRTKYTSDVAEFLAALLPEGMEGSISTSPCAFKALHPKGKHWSIYFNELVKIAVRLAELRRRTGKMIRLAIEPEPLCVLETTDEAIAFFGELWNHVAGREEEAAVRAHLGLCYDVCHQAVEFEPIGASVARLDGAGIRINKIHLTCALELRDPRDTEARSHLAMFVEERYLHQTIAVQANGNRLTMVDLTEAHAKSPPREWLETGPWRIHFHVPVNRERMGPLWTTRSQLWEVIDAAAALSYAPHLEVETYTWSVMPQAGGLSEPFDLAGGLVDEMKAVLARLDAAGAAH